MSGALWDGATIKPDQMQSINAILIVIMIPIFEYGIYPILSKFNILTRPLQRMTFGGLLAAVSFILTAFIQLSIENSPPGTVSMLWQSGQYVVITCGEVMFSITGLEFSYSQVIHAWTLPSYMLAIVSHHLPHLYPPFLLRLSLSLC